MVKILRENNELKQIPLECLKGVTLLSDEEAENLLTQEERKCTYKGQPCRWWLRSPAHSSFFADCVYCRGSVSFNGEYVDYGDVCVRPVLILNLNSSNLQIGDIFEFGEHRFKIISNSYALCEDAIEKYVFRKDQREKDANVYESSDIKNFIDDWFYKIYKDMKCKEYGVETDDEIFNGKKGEWANW